MPNDPEDVDPEGFLRALLKISPEDAEKVRKADFDWTSLVGLPVEEARQIVEGAGLSFRVAEPPAFAVGMDYWPDRAGHGVGETGGENARVMSVSYERPTTELRRRRTRTG